MTELLYWSMIAAFFTHELDAVKRHEWRILPLVSRLPEKTAEQVFIWAHVPIVLGIVWLSRSGAETPFTLGLSVFAMVHVVLHWAFRTHAANEFTGIGSWAIIVLAGACGAAHLAASLWN